MSSLSRYQRIVRGWKSVQFEIISFSLIVLGVLLAWKLSRRPDAPDWIVYIIIMWGIGLILHIWRIIYLIRRIRKD